MLDATEEAATLNAPSISNSMLESIFAMVLPSYAVFVLIGMTVNAAVPPCPLHS